MVVIAYKMWMTRTSVTFVCVASQLNIWVPTESGKMSKTPFITNIVGHAVNTKCIIAGGYIKVHCNKGHHI